MSDYWQRTFIVELIVDHLLLFFIFHVFSNHREVVVFFSKLEKLQTVLNDSGRKWLSKYLSTS